MVGDYTEDLESSLSSVDFTVEKVILKSTPRLFLANGIDTLERKNNQ
jgi:hypothetical protein